MPSDLRKLQLHALFCAFAAKSDCLSPDELSRLERLSLPIDPEQPLLTDVRAFVQEMRRRGQSAASRAAAGANLYAAIERSTWTVPDAGRKDIHG